MSIINISISSVPNILRQHITIYPKFFPLNWSADLHFLPLFRYNSSYDILLVQIFFELFLFNTKQLPPPDVLACFYDTYKPANSVNIVLVFLNFWIKCFAAEFKVYYAHFWIPLREWFDTASLILNISVFNHLTAKLITNWSNLLPCSVIN